MPYRSKKLGREQKMTRYSLHDKAPSTPLYEKISTEFNYWDAQKLANVQARKGYAPYIRKRKGVFTTGSVYTVYQRR